MCGILWCLKLKIGISAGMTFLKMGLKTELALGAIRFNFVIRDYF